MIAIPPGVRIYLAMGPTDMRKGFDGLSMLAQELLKQEPFSGHLFVFRGKRGDLVKVLYWDGQGFCLFAKRLEKGRFVSYGLCQSPERGSSSRRASLSGGFGILIYAVRIGQGAEDVSTVAQTLIRGLGTS